MQLTLDKLGRTVIPKAIRRTLGLQPGDKLEASTADGSVVLRPVSMDSCLRCEGGVLVYTGEVAGDLVKAIQQQRDARLEHVTAWRGEE